VHRKEEEFGAEQSLGSRYTCDENAHPNQGKEGKEPPMTEVSTMTIKSWPKCPVKHGMSESGRA